MFSFKLDCAYLQSKKRALKAASLSFCLLQSSETLTNRRKLCFILSPLSQACTDSFHNKICMPDTALTSAFFFFFNVLSLQRLKGLISRFYNSAANKQTCLFLLPLTWMQRQLSFPFSKDCHESVKHMPSAPEAMKNKSTNKWISNHKGRKYKALLNLVWKKTALSQLFLCFWAFCFWDNPACILGNTSVSESLISLGLCSYFSDQARCKKASVGWFKWHCWII